MTDKGNAQELKQQAAKELEAATREMNKAKQRLKGIEIANRFTVEIDGETLKVFIAEQDRRNAQTHWVLFPSPDHKGQWVEESIAYFDLPLAEMLNQFGVSLASLIWWDERKAAKESEDEADS